MATLTIKKSDGTSAGSLELNDSVFGAEPNAVVVRSVVNQLLANRRQGTHATKTRAFVSGGGRKPYKQKGTGNARQGSTRAPQWRHGAIIFGPQPRDYRKAINKKVRQVALRSILSELVKSERLIVIDNFAITAPKTRDFVALLGRLGVNLKNQDTALVIKPANDAALELSARNIAQVNIINQENINALDLLNHDYVIATSDVIKHLEQTYA